MNIEYVYKDDKILFEFELTNGRVLNLDSSDEDNIDVKTIKFTECFSSILDDRGEHPNKFYMAYTVQIIRAQSTIY